MTLPAPEDWPVADAVPDVSPDLLRARARATPDRLAVVAEGDRWTYGALDSLVDRTAASLSGDWEAEGRIGLLAERGPALWRGVAAAWRLGASAVLLNPQLADAALADQCERAEVGLLACTDATAARAASVAPGGAERVVLSASQDSHGGEAGEGHGDGDTAAETDTLAAERLVMFTSGTTGRPKGVRLTGRNLAASANASAARLSVASRDRWLVPLPTHHMGGLAPLVRSTLYGTAAVLQREFDPEETAAAMCERRVTGVSLVPTMLARLLDAGWSPPEHLRFVLLGGGPIPAELIDRCERRGAPVHPTYGMTETASQVATATPAEAFAHEGTVGRPLRDTAVSVVADEGAVRAGKSGEIVVDGPTVTPGYLDASRTAAAFGERGFHTGDRGQLDEDGRLYVEGRADERIVTGGENVDPAVVAEALRDHPAIEDAAVVGLPDEEWGERVAAAVVPAETVETAELRRHARERLADFQVPKTLAVVDALPRTPSGTFDREAVRERLARE